jgi:hypothetical protein
MSYQPASTVTVREGSCKIGAQNNSHESSPSCDHNILDIWQWFIFCATNQYWSLFPYAVIFKEFVGLCNWSTIVRQCPSYLGVDWEFTWLRAICDVSGRHYVKMSGSEWSRQNQSLGSYVLLYIQGVLLAVSKKEIDLTYEAWSSPGILSEKVYLFGAHLLFIRLRGALNLMKISTLWSRKFHSP